MKDLKVVDFVKLPLDIFAQAEEFSLKQIMKKNKEKFTLQISSKRDTTRLNELFEEK